MKGLVIILILAAAGYLAYTYLYVPLSDEDKLLQSMEKRFDEASRSLLSSGRMAGATGLDTTSDADLAIRRVRRIENELKNWTPTRTEETSKPRADELLGKIREFKQKVGLL